MDESSESEAWSRVCPPLWPGPSHVKCSVGKYQPPKEMLRSSQLIKRPAFAASLVRNHSVEQLLSCNIHKTHAERQQGSISGLNEGESWLLAPVATATVVAGFHWTCSLVGYRRYSWKCSLKSISPTPPLIL